MNFHQSVKVSKINYNTFIYFILNFFKLLCLFLGIQCGFPAEIRRGSYTLLNDSVGYLSEVLYTCEPGSRMIGRARLTCDLDERWNGPPPR